jgi:hypothetical protein
MFKFTSPSAAVMTATDLQQRVEEVRRGFDEQPPPGRSESFGHKLSAAAKRLARQRPIFSQASASAASNEGESFAEKLSREIQRQLGSRSQQAARDRADKEKARYRGYKRKPNRSG